VKPIKQGFVQISSVLTEICTLMAYIAGFLLARLDSLGIYENFEERRNIGSYIIYGILG
jgi:hypothetical protein